MCGIFGMALNRPLNADDRMIAHTALGRLHHRGPDDSGLWTDEGAGVLLGHTRLAILDLSSASHQPFVDDLSALVYNGEIYNYREIRRELENAGSRFHSQGDTEVVLRAWQSWGGAALERFDGMFAFAVYYDRRLHLITDPFGEKPLYWARTDSGIVFCSEPEPLAEAVNAERDMDAVQMASFMGLGFTGPEQTGYSSIRRLRPATHLVIEPDRQIHSWVYWRVPEPVPADGNLTPLSEDQLDAVEDVLCESLQRRIHADVPLGLFLSSGVDSALIAALAACRLKVDLKALTVAFPDGRDESEAASAIAQHLGIDHCIIDSRQDPYQATPEYLLDLYGEPNDNLTAIAVRQMSGLARPHFKVALTGAGGDELFYGYGRYDFAYRWRGLLSLPAAFRRPIGGALSPLIQRPRSWGLGARLCADEPARHLLTVRNFPAGEAVEALPGTRDLVRTWFGSDVLADPEAAESFQSMRYYDLLYTLPVSYIPAIERGSMRASLEVRTPYLHRPLLELLSQFDQRALVAFGQKSVLKRLLRRYLPEKLVDRPKRGFVFPSKRFLSNISEASPQVPALGQAQADLIWSRRHQPGWQKLAVRLSILQTFLQHQSREVS